MLLALARRVAKPLLENALGAYLPEELDLNQLELHVPDGRLRLRSLALHAEELNRSFFPAGPVYVQTAEIGELMSEVPYKQLATQPCRLEARGVRIKMAIGKATMGPSPEVMSTFLEVLPDTPPSMRSSMRPDMNTTAIDSLTHFLERLLLQLHLSASDIVVELQAPSGAIFQLRIPELKAEAKRVELSRGAEVMLIPPKQAPICLARLEPGAAGAAPSDDSHVAIEATFAALRLLIAPLQLTELQALIEALQANSSPTSAEKHTDIDEDELKPPSASPKRDGPPMETALNEDDKGVIALLQAGLVPDAEPDNEGQDSDSGGEDQFKEARGPQVAPPADEEDKNAVLAPPPALPPRVSITLILESFCVSLVPQSLPAVTFLPWSAATSPPSVPSARLSSAEHLTLCSGNLRMNALHHTGASTYSMSMSSCTVHLNSESAGAVKLLSLSDLDDKEEAVSDSQQQSHSDESALSLTVMFRSRPDDSEDALEQRQITLRAPRLALFYQPHFLPLFTPYISLFSIPPSSLSTSFLSSSSPSSSALPASPPPITAGAAAVSATQQTNVSVAVGRLAIAAQLSGEGRLVAELSGLSLQGISATETKLLGDADALLLSLIPENGAPLLLAEAALRHTSEAAATPLELTLRAPPPPALPAAPAPHLPPRPDREEYDQRNPNMAVPLHSAAEGPFSAFLSSFEGRKARRMEAREEELARFRHESVAAAAYVLALALPTLRLEVPLSRVLLLRRILSALGGNNSEKKVASEPKPEDLPRAAVALTVGEANIIVRSEAGDTVELNGDGMRLLLSVRHNGGPRSYAAFALSAFRISDSDVLSTEPQPFLFSVGQSQRPASAAAAEAAPALSLAAELPLLARDTPHDLLVTLRGVALDASPRRRPALQLYSSLAPSATTPSPATPVTFVTSASTTTLQPPPLPRTPQPPATSLPVIVTTSAAATPSTSRTPSVHTTSSAPTAAPSSSTASTSTSTSPTLPAVQLVSYALQAEDVWVWLDAPQTNKGPCARLAVRASKLDVLPEPTDTLFLLRGAAFFLRNDGGARPLATEGSRPAGGAWADIGGADFVQLSFTPSLVSVTCPALKVALCADSYAVLVALSTSLATPPPASAAYGPQPTIEVRSISVMEAVDDSAFAPPASAAAAGLIEDYAGEQSPLSPSIYGSVLLNPLLVSALSSASASVSSSTPKQPQQQQVPPQRSAPSTSRHSIISHKPAAATAPPLRPVCGIAEVEAALRPDARHVSSQSISGDDERPKLEAVDPASGAPKQPGNPLADLLRRMNLSRLLPAFASHAIDLDVLRAIVARSQEADLAALLKLTVAEQAQITAAVRSLGRLSYQPPNGAHANPNRGSAASAREDYKRDSGAKWLGPTPEVIDEYHPPLAPVVKSEGYWHLELQDSGVLVRLHTGEDFGAGRDSAHVECRLEQLRVTFSSATNKVLNLWQIALGSPLSMMELTVGELNAVDALQARSIAGFALRLMCSDPAHPRVLDTPLLRLQWRLIEAAPEAEHWLQIHATPLAMHLTQAAWEFLAKFFDTQSQKPPVNTGPEGPFIQRCLMAPLSLKLSYEPELSRGIDVGLLRQGATSELLKLVPLSNSQFKFAGVDVAGVMGWSSLYNHVKLHWLAAMYTQHVFSYAAGVTAVHHVGQVAEGLYELVYTPFAQSRRDGRLVLGLQRGAASAFRTLLSEAAALGLSLASGAHKLVGGTAAPAQTSAGAGLQAAYGSVARQAREASNIVSIPLVEYQRSGTTGMVKAVLRAVPVLLLLPARGLTETASQTLAGLREQLEGVEFHAKYTPHGP